MDKTGVQPEGGQQPQNKNKLSKKRKAAEDSVPQSKDDSSSKKPASNWEKLRQKIVTDVETSEIDASSIRRRKKKPRHELASAVEHVEVEAARKAAKKPVFDITKDDSSLVDKSKYIALDCEMVGMGADGKKSALARCAIVDYDGNIIYDEYVRPPGFVTDFRTKYSGIRKKDLRYGTAITLHDCQERVDAIIKGKILVGHALKNDLDVLMLKHPRHSIRDTATYRPYMRPHGRKGGKFKPRALKELTKQHLGYEIQGGEHDPGEDARAPMMLYRHKRLEWERSLATAGKKKKEINSKPKAVQAATGSAVQASSKASVGEKVSQMFKS